MIRASGLTLRRGTKSVLVISCTTSPAWLSVRARNFTSPNSGRERETRDGGRQAAARQGQAAAHHHFAAPVAGSRVSIAVCGWAQSNMPLIDPAIASNEPWPRRCPPIQLSSMKRITLVWSVTVWST